MMEHPIRPCFPQDFSSQQQFYDTNAIGNFWKQPGRQVLGRTQPQWQHPNQRYTQQHQQTTELPYFPPQMQNAEMHSGYCKSHTLPPRTRSAGSPMFSRSLSEGGASPIHSQMNNLQVSAPEQRFPSSPVFVEAQGDSSPPAENHSLGLVGKPVSVLPKPVRALSTLDEEGDSDSDPSDTHPNKFAIAIEEHTNRLCGYKRQPHRSGPQVKVVKKTGEVYSPIGPSETTESEQELTRRYYRKDLVRVCVCGKYDTKEALLENRGRDNDADGYEVHYNIKCKWKSYEDFKTKKRVIIRLCKCYKPSF